MNLLLHTWVSLRMGGTLVQALLIDKPTLTAITCVLVNFGGVKNNLTNIDGLA